MIEFIIGAFLYAKFKKRYDLKPIFKHWSIYLPLFFAVFYIFLEYTMFIEWYYFIPYGQIIKTATLLSYIPLIIVYKLYESDNIKYKNNEFLKLIMSPMTFAGFMLWAGSMLNKVAMKYNGGYMPTFPSNSYWTGYIKPEFINDGLHTLGNPYSGAIPLCNIFDLGFTCVSLGDLLVRMYVFIIIYYSIKYSNKTLK